MRLLHTRTLQVLEFVDEDAPPYAALSHTWTDSEVSFHEIQSLNPASPHEVSTNTQPRVDATRQKTGFRKIQAVCSAALQDGYMYVWVDTCCIDKSSSSELTEAINSMFQYYRNCGKCYAFLADVPPAHVQDPSAPDSDFSRSRWFTRGWTLQELIAPKNVLFLAKDWTPLGHKSGDGGLCDIISRVTGIPAPILQGARPIEALSVATRMNWAAHRQTKKPEDVAYSLLGLFGVQMPLLYGEGKKKAFLRLQASILESNFDPSIFVWNIPEHGQDDPDAVSGLLAESPLHFKDSGGIEVMPPSATATSVPAEMTSHGLRVQLYLRPAWTESILEDSEDYYAILDCVVRIGPRLFCPVLWLRRLGFDQFGRLRIHLRKLLPPVDRGMPAIMEGYQPVFVRQEPRYYKVPGFVADEIALEGMWEVDSVFPEDRWNPVTGCLSSTFSRGAHVVGVFRLRTELDVVDTFDVVVGLTKEFGLTWTAWCFQRRCGDRSLSETFEQSVTETAEMEAARSSNDLYTPWLFDNDSFLLSSVSVEQVERNRRYYFSLRVTQKNEICGTEIFSMPQPVESQQEREIRIITSCYAMDDPVSIPRDSGTPSFKAGERLSAVRKRCDFTAIPDLGARIGASSNFSLHQAVITGDNLSLGTMFREGPHAVDDQTEHGWTVLHVAAFMGNENAMRHILRCPPAEPFIGKLIDSRTTGFLETPLHLLVAHAPQIWQLPCLNVLCSAVPAEEAFTQLTARNALDETILHRAAVSDNASLIERLVELIQQRNEDHNRNQELRTTTSTYNADFRLNIDVTDKFGRSPLWHAAAAGAHQAVDRLVKLGASVNLADDLGLAPLHAASRSGHGETVQALIRLGANPNMKLDFFHASGVIPLHLAALFGHSECIQALVNAHPRGFVLLDLVNGVNSNLKPVDLAVIADSLESVKILTAAGASCTEPCRKLLEPAVGTEGEYAKVIEVSDEDTGELAKRLGRDEIYAHICSLPRYAEYQQTRRSQTLVTAPGQVSETRITAGNHNQLAVTTTDSLAEGGTQTYGSLSSQLQLPLRPILPPFLSDMQPAYVLPPPLPGTYGYPTQLYSQVYNLPTTAQPGAATANFPLTLEYPQVQAPALAPPVVPQTQPYYPLSDTTNTYTYQPVAASALDPPAPETSYPYYAPPPPPPGVQQYTAGGNATTFAPTYTTPDFPIPPPPPPPPPPRTRSPPIPGDFTPSQVIQAYKDLALVQTRLEQLRSHVDSTPEQQCEVDPRALQVYLDHEAELQWLTNLYHLEQTIHFEQEMNEGTEVFTPRGMPVLELSAGEDTRLTDWKELPRHSYGGIWLRTAGDGLVRPLLLALLREVPLTDGEYLDIYSIDDEWFDFFHGGVFSDADNL